MAFSIKLLLTLALLFKSTLSINVISNERLHPADLSMAEWRQRIANFSASNFSASDLLPRANRGNINQPTPPPGVGTGYSFPGYIGTPITQEGGDYARRTFCYCQDQLPSTGELGRGHYWHLEYYNFHTNATHFIDHHCLKYNIDWRSRHKTTACAWDGWWVDDYQLVYNPDPKHSLDFKFRRMKTFHGDIVMDIQWGTPFHPEMIKGNHRTHFQRRALDSSQGEVKTPIEVVNPMCEELCQREMGMPLDTEYLSHEETFVDVDDMCEHCK